MTQKHRSEPHDWREGRRLRAWELHQQGWKQKDIAAALGVTPGAVSQWLKRGRAGGVAQLRRQPPPGAQPRLSPEQLTELRELLAQGAEAFGFIGQVWTSKRVAAVIKRFLGVTYHRAHVSRLLRTLGFSVQKPIVRAAQRDDAVIAAWWDARWPALKKTLPHSSRPSSG
jgi:transposase